MLEIVNEIWSFPKMQCGSGRQYESHGEIEMSSKLESPARRRVSMICERRDEFSWFVLLLFKEVIS